MDEHAILSGNSAQSRFVTFWSGDAVAASEKWTAVHVPDQPGRRRWTST